MTHVEIKKCKIHVQYNGVCVCVCPSLKLRPCCTLAHVIHNTLRPMCWDMRIVTFSFNLLWLLSAICRQIIRGIQIYALKSLGVSTGKLWITNLCGSQTCDNRSCQTPTLFKSFFSESPPWLSMGTRHCTNLHQSITRSCGHVAHLPMWYIILSANVLGHAHRHF